MRIIFPRPWLRGIHGVIILVLLISLLLASIYTTLASQRSSYEIANQAPFNQPAYYPTTQSVAPDLYQPTGDWVGRLVLPSTLDGQDWVWLEVYHAPANYHELEGQKVRLEWENSAQNYVQAATQTIRLSTEAKESQKQGNVHPVRLNSRQVGPLQSLAGARSNDDVTVILEPQVVNLSQGHPILQIMNDPVQVAGRYSTVVKILKPLAEQGRNMSPPCLEPTACPRELFNVRHYNPVSQAFDGPQEVIRIPQVLANRNGVYHSTIHGLERSPAGVEGWYIYGAQDADGMFVANAIAPRSLFTLQPDQILTANAVRHHWKLPKQKGTAHTLLVAPDANTSQEALARWREGDRALVLHLFGGIGGQKAEPQAVIGTVTGHFGFGIAQVIREPLTQTLRFQIQYQQVYSHNPSGIIAGPAQWSEYMGHLQRGWLGSRPVTDVLIQLPALTEDYNFDGIIISPLQELQQQLQLMAARYRTGDGTGASLVTPAKSCVQDSSQAVYVTVKVIEERIRQSPQIQNWLRTHPQDPQTQRFQVLTALKNQLEQELVPLGIVRPDWQQNAEVLAGTRPQQEFTNQDNLITQILSWRTIIPRVAHDQLTQIFQDLDAQLWVLQTNQVGGWDTSIAPLAATELLGRWPVVPRVFSRLIDALGTLPTSQGWLISAMILLMYTVIALPLGWQQGFLRQSVTSPSRRTILTTILGTFFAPAFIEELVFRALLVPHPNEDAWPQTTLVWASISLVLFITYHPLNALTAYRRGAPTFFQPIFLILAALLGIACTATYLMTRSLWPGVLLHGLVVAVWLLWLGGMERLRLNNPPFIPYTERTRKS